MAPYKLWLRNLIFCHVQMVSHPQGDFIKKYKLCLISFWKHSYFKESRKQNSQHFHLLNYKNWLTTLRTQYSLKLKLHELQQTVNNELHYLSQEKGRTLVIVCQSFTGAQMANKAKSNEETIQANSVLFELRYLSFSPNSLWILHSTCTYKID